MTFLIAIITIIIIIFEVSLKEISMLSNLSLCFILINLLFWFKQYKVAFWSGVLSAILIDLIMQNQIGTFLFSLFAPILFLTFIDNIIKIDSKISHILFAIISLIISILLSDFIMKLIFLKYGLSLALIVKRILFSGLFLIFLSFVFGRIFLKERGSNLKYYDKYYK